MKKLLLGLLFLAPALTLVGCNLNEKYPDANGQVTFENMYDYSAISGINLLKTTFNSQMKMAKTTDTEKQEIIDNLKVLEGMMNEGIAKGADLPSDKEGYEKMYELTTINFDGTYNEYDFYFNEIIIEDDDDDDKFDKIFEEKEVESHLEGIVILDGIEYKMTGEKEVEGNELEMKFKVSLDDQNYVIVEQEIENDEEEFNYTKYENGIKVFETSIEFERDIFDKEFEFTVKEQTEEGLVSYKYEYDSYELEKYVKVTKKVNNETDVIYIKIVVDEDNNVSYVFE